MNTPSPQVRARDLILRWCDDRLSTEETNELGGLIEADPEIGRLFAELAHVNATLENLGPALPQTVTLAHRPIRWPVRLLSLSAVLVAIAIPTRLFIVGQSPKADPEGVAKRQAATDFRSLAVVNHILDASWQEGTTPLRPGDLIGPCRIKFDSGLIQLQFFNGVQAVIQGPADLEIISAEESFCHLGRIHAIVPPQADCFRVRTSQGELIDFGTEFGLNVSTEGASVHVFDGEVAFEQGADKLPTRLGAGRAALIGLDGSAKPLEADANLFASYREVNQMQAMSTEKRLTDWYRSSLFWRSHPAGVAYFDFEDKDYLSGTIRSDNGNPYRTPVTGLLVGVTLTEGRWPGKAGLVFTRTSDRVRVNFPGTHRALTMAAWVRLNQLDSRIHGLLMSDGTREGAVHWSIDGSSQSLRLDTGSILEGSGHAYFSDPAITTDLTGQWAFLATCYDANQGVVSHFLNGKNIGKQAIEGSDSLRIGVADIGNWSSASADEHHLEGVIDELMVFSVSLDSSQLTGIAATGRPY